MPKSFSSTKDANDALDELGIGEFVIICNAFFRVVSFLGGRCFKRVTPEFYQKICQAGDRNFSGGKKNSHQMKSCIGA